MEEFNIKEWLQKAKDDPKVAAQPVVIILAVLYFGYKFFYLPQTVLLKKEKASLKTLQDQKGGLEEAVKNKENLKMEVVDLQRIRSEIEKKCYKKSESAFFMQDIRKLGKQIELDIKNITPMPPSQRKYLDLLDYEEFPVKIVFQGTFRQLGLFLRSVEKCQKKISIELPSLVPDASGTFRLELFPTCLVLPDEYYSKPVAKEETDE
ncbi:MAG: type 4a pilus biogenesis protein PilO [Candidatus Riflebacteria bacterium]|nr:type 4a pilus biogenesis protein PilO [Candidatus Riflebacteria bacterium]